MNKNRVKEYKAVVKLQNALNDFVLAITQTEDLPLFFAKRLTILLKAPMDLIEHEKELILQNETRISETEAKKQIVTIIKEVMLKRNLTPSQLATILDIPQGSINQILNSKHYLNVRTLLNIERKLGCNFFTFTKNNGIT